MYGGLKKSASRLALVAAAGVLSTSAFAADLGGDCCADLEERVAELEATTARKGTRKTSLEIWGDVNKAIVGWNDGINRQVVLGTDNVTYSTRFGLRGNAKIAPSLTAGYSIVIEQSTGGRSTNISQFADRASFTGIASTTGPVPSTAGGFQDAGILMRESNWWIESSSVGRVTLGRINASGTTGVIGVVDLGGVALAGSPVSTVGSGLTFRTNTLSGQTQTGAAARGSYNYTNYTLANTTDSVGEYGSRFNGILYSSPTLAGFSLTGALANELYQDTQCGNTACTANLGQGLTYFAALKYAGEFSGFRVAGALGYENANNNNSTSMFATNGTSIRPNATNTGVSASLLHVPTGLFVQGFYNQYTRGHDLFTTAGAASVYSTAGSTSDTARQFSIQAGISKNFFGVGNTGLYGEYQQTMNGYNTFGLEGTNGNAFINGATSTIAAGTTAVATATSYTGDNTSLKMWGLGATQNIDAAAMTLYTSYKNYTLSSQNCTNAGGCKSIGVFLAGAQIRF